MERERTIPRIWTEPRPLVGMVHLPALPGSPGWRRGAQGGMAAVVDRATADAALMAEGGLDGVLVENFNDAPYYPERVPPETLAAMAVVVAAVVDAVDVPVGVNVLRNDAASALAVAIASGASFVRVNVHTGGMLTDQGWISGRAHETIRRRAELGADDRPVAVLADVFVKHATPPAGADLEGYARDAWYRGMADALIVSGAATGHAVDRVLLRAAKEAVPEAPIWIGSGITPENAAVLLGSADGAIVGSTLMRDGRAGSRVDRARVERLVSVLRG